MILFIGTDGKEEDWIGGYGPPPELFLKKFQKTLAGSDTYRVLNDRYAKEPDNVEVVFKLARKFEEREAWGDRPKELYRKVVALDPDGKSGSYTDEFLKASIPYTQAAEEALGRMAYFSRENNPAPLRAFIAKYPESPLLKNDYLYLVYHYLYSAPKDEAAKFFAEYASKYPNDASVLNSCVERIIKDKEPLDKGIELAQKIKEIAGYIPNPVNSQNLAQLYSLKGDMTKANEEYGKDFIDGYVSTAINALTNYANFWLGQNKNLESAEVMTDLAVRMAPASKWRTLQTAAGIYVKLNKTDKAIGIYGPDFLKKNMVEQDIRWSYANFWSRQGKNLDSALEAAAKSVELEPNSDSYYTLGNILFELRKHDEALRAAEKAIELAKIAAEHQGVFLPTQQYEDLVKRIKDALAKEKGPAIKK